MSIPSHHAGVSLIELLICLTLIAIISCFMTPFSSTMYHKNQLTLVADEIKSAVRYAKIQSILRGEGLLLVPKDSAKGWSSGLALYRKHHLKDKLHEWSWDIEPVLVSWRGFQSKHYLYFTPDLAHNALNGTFSIMNPEQSIQLRINRLGHVNKAVVPDERKERAYDNVAHTPR